MHHEPDRLTGRAQILRRAEPAREIIIARRAGVHGVFGIVLYRVERSPMRAGLRPGDLPPNHGVATDFKRSAAFRALAHELGMSAAALAHRYALSMPGVDTVVLGCKNTEVVLRMHCPLLRLVRSIPLL